MFDYAFLILLLPFLSAIVLGLAGIIGGLVILNNKKKEGSK